VAAGSNNDALMGISDDFVGRAAECAELAAAVAADRGGVVLIAGEAGAGKTRLLHQDQRL
jgi:tRNA A37 threonylcarbamoyladenosine biosynthesis protein TsaE